MQKMMRSNCAKEERYRSDTHNYEGTHRLAIVSSLQPLADRIEGNLGCCLAWVAIDTS